MNETGKEMVRLIIMKVLCFTLFALFLDGVKCMDAASDDALIDDNDMKAVIRRLEYLEARDKQRELDNKMLRQQMTSYREEIVSLKNENAALTERVEVAEATNENLQKRLDDLEIFIGPAEDRIRLTNAENEKSSANIPDYILRPRDKRSENDAIVAFYVTLNNSIEHLGTNQNIVFDHVITNLGNAYNVHAGDFRAPFDGTYVFSVTLTAHGIHQNHYRVVKNGVTFGHLYNRGTEAPFASASLTTIVQLQAGDTVSVANVEADEKLFGNNFSAFSGFLLQQDYAYPAIVG